MSTLETQPPNTFETARHATLRTRVARFGSFLMGRGMVAVPEAPFTELGTHDVPEMQDEPLLLNQEEVSENYTAEMAAWTNTLTQELADITSQSTENSAKAERYLALTSKMHTAELEGHAWLDDGELAHRGITKRYGTYSELHGAAKHLSRRFSRLNQQLDYARNYNQVLEFADEIDPSVYRRFITEPNQLGEAFNLPRTNKPTTNPQEAADQLNTLPFVNWKDVREVIPRQHPAITIKGHFDFPTERIIGVASFASWAGRGEEIRGIGLGSVKLPNGKGGKGFTPRSLPDVERTSRGAITDYAQSPYMVNAEYVSEATIILVQDSAGEYWGFATTEGSYRVAAVKLRGESSVPVGKIEINSDEDMYRLDYAVRDKLQV